MDANGSIASSVGSVRYDVKVGDPSTPANEADVRLTFRITDVRKQSDLSAYTGEVLVDSPLRITDKSNDVSGTEPSIWFIPAATTDLSGGQNE